MKQLPRISLLEENSLAGTGQTSGSSVPSNNPDALTWEKIGKAWQIVVQWAILPYRLIGLVALGFIIPGLFHMVALIDLSKDNAKDLSVMALLAQNRNRSATPLAHFQYRDKVRPQMIDATPTQSIVADALFCLSLTAIDTQLNDWYTQKQPDGSFLHSLEYSSGEARTESSTTPHMKIRKDEIDEAYQQLVKLFPGEQDGIEILEWGEALFLTEWLLKNPYGEVPKKTVYPPHNGTMDEHVWILWTVLRGEFPDAKDELHRLEELFVETFPSESDQRAALEWAKMLYDRMDNNFRDYQKHLSDIRREKATDSSREQTNKVFIDFQRVLPPRTRWTYLWFIYRYVGLSESSRKAARAHWNSFFSPSGIDQVEALGAKWLQERKSYRDPLPPVPDMLPMLCYVERMTTIDYYTEDCLRRLKSNYTGKERNSLEFALTYTYPNDEFFFLQGMEDPFRLHRYSSGTDDPWIKAKDFLAFPLLIYIVALGLKTVLGGLGYYLLRQKEAKQRWEEYEEARGSDPLWLWWVSVLAVAALGAVTAPYTLPDYLAVQINSPVYRFIGSVVATVIGGMLINAVRHVAAIYLVIFGVELHTTWWDEIIGIVVAGLFLYTFDNGLFSIALFALADAASGLIHMLFVRKPKEDMSPENQTYMHTA